MTETLDCGGLGERCLYLYGIHQEPVPLRLANEINLEIRGEAFNLAPGVNDVPQFLAIFLAARGLATVAPEA